jgi:GNAT superfamily N-acetyltransferase
MDPSLRLRIATPADIDEAVAIDDDASALFVRAGIDLNFGREHPYFVAEREHWTRCMREGNAYLVGPEGGTSVALLVLDHLDGLHYLEQLSVRQAAMRQGIGGWLLKVAKDWAAGRPLWLTTYGHVEWNRPYYERAGFTIVQDADCPPGIQALLEDQRRNLPAPEHRVAMRHGGDLD